MITVRGLTKRFGTRTVLNELELDIQQGETLVVVGRSGCGKSILLKHLLGLIEPDAGEVRVDGLLMDEASHPKEIKRMRLKFGMLFQSAALFDSLSVQENVGFGLMEHTRKSPAEIRARVLECLEMVGLSSWESAMPQELSGGMRKRVGLARAIAMRPEILLFDEPTTGLDPMTADAINALMVKLKDSLRATSVVVTHDLRSARRIATRIALMDEGKIHFSGTLKQFEETEDPVVKEFLST